MEVPGHLVRSLILALALPLGLLGSGALRAQPARLQSVVAQASSASSGSMLAAERVLASEIPEQDAVRFLMQATFGPIPCDAARVQQIGFESWFDEQLEEQVSLERPWLQWLASLGQQIDQNDRETAWLYFAVAETDQFRQRTAWALSQILVVSLQDPCLSQQPLLLADYYDQLAIHAFGNYRDLLEVVAKHPAMGAYLGMLQNSAIEGGQADENFARELMQLFAIGLFELEPDGTLSLDDQGQPLATYTQAEVEGLARALTGWNYAAASEWDDPTPNYLPMEAWPEHHDSGPKTILGGVVLPAGQSAEQDLDQALDTIFAHLNVGPFLAKRLIQHYVTSNPSPAYVTRVAAVFDDDGSGLRGELGAVVRALLLDPEARSGQLSSPETFGKLKEPVLRHLQLWRLLRALYPQGGYVVPNMFGCYAQAPLNAPTVTGFFLPSFAPSRSIMDLGLVAPEFQISDHGHLAATTNRFHGLIFEGFLGYPELAPWQSTIQLDVLLPLSAEPAALVDWLARYAMAGNMSDHMRNVAQSLVADTPLDDGGTQRVLEALYLVFTSPEFAVQK